MCSKRDSDHRSPETTTRIVIDALTNQATTAGFKAQFTGYLCFVQDAEGFSVPRRPDMPRFQRGRGHGGSRGDSVSGDSTRGSSRKYIKYSLADVDDLSDKSNARAGDYSQVYALDLYTGIQWGLEFRIHLTTECFEGPFLNGSVFEWSEPCYSNSYEQTI